MSQEMTTTTNGEFSIAEFCDRYEACTEGRACMRCLMETTTNVRDE